MASSAGVCLKERCSLKGRGVVGWVVGKWQTVWRVGYEARRRPHHSSLRCLLEGMRPELAYGKVLLKQSSWAFALLVVVEGGIEGAQYMKIVELLPQRIEDGMCQTASLRPSACGDGP